MSIDKQAASNRPGWERSAEQVCAKDSGAKAFWDEAKASRVGTDVTADKVVQFCESEPPRLVSTPSMWPGGVDDFFDRGVWGPRRDAIETHLDARGEVVYGTLDLPGATGDPTYGPYRLVSGPRDDEQFLVVPHNSAGVYGATGNVDQERLASEVADWEGRGALATSERGVEAAKMPRDSWPGILAAEVHNQHCEYDLIEVLARNGARELRTLSEVRVRRSFDDEVISRQLEAQALHAASVDVPVAASNLLRNFAEDGLFDWTVVP